MKKILAILMGIALLTSATHVYASSWDGNPLDRIDLYKVSNKSPHPDEKVKLQPKSYSWKTSKVCGLTLCKANQFPHLQNVLREGLNAQYGIDFDGKVKIKGYFPLH